MTGKTPAILCTGQLQQWLQRAFKPALQLVQTHGLAVDTPLVAVIRNALSHLTHVGTKHDFACGLFRGLGANLDEVGRQRLAAEISKLTGEPNVLLGASQGDIAALLRYSQPLLAGSLGKTDCCHLPVNDRFQQTSLPPCSL